MSKRKWIPYCKPSEDQVNFPSEEDLMEEDLLLPEEEEDLGDDSALEDLIKLLRELLTVCKRLSTQLPPQHC